MASHDVVKALTEKDLREALSGQFHLAAEIAEILAQRFVETGYVNSYEHSPFYDLIEIFYRVGVDAGTVYERREVEQPATAGG